MVLLHHKVFIKPMKRTNLKKCKFNSNGSKLATISIVKHTFNISTWAEN